MSEPGLEVVAWNGHPGAASFTFDDAYGSHLDAAAPALDARNLRGTFFVVCDALSSRLAEWQALAENGHEIANHTMSHARPSGGNIAEIEDCDAMITAELGRASQTFAYPFVAVGEPYVSYSRSNYVAARGGGDRTVHTDDRIDWTALPTYFTGPGGGVGTPRDEIIAALDRATGDSGWAIITAHSVETDSYYARIPRSDLEAMLDHAVTSDLWIDTFVHVAAYLRGQQLLERAEPRTSDGGALEWTWDVPPRMPTPTTIRVLIDGGNLSQGGEAVEWDGEDGYYAVDVSRGALRWAP